MQCGKEMDFRQFGPGRICPHCGRESVIVDVKEAHVLFSRLSSDAFSTYINDESLDGVLHRNGRNYRINIDYRRFFLQYDLTVGNIADPPFSNANCYAHGFASAGSLREAIEHQLESLLQLDESVPIYLWLEDGDSPEHLLNLLFFARCFERFREVYLVRWYHAKNFVGEKKAMLKGLLNRELLTKQELLKMSDRYREIASLGAEVLVGDSSGVEGWSMRRVQDYVLRFLSSQYQGFSSVFLKIQKAIRKEIGVGIAIDTVKEAFYQLLRSGEIEGENRYALWEGANWNSSLITQKFRLKMANDLRCSREEALLSVCYAFGIGNVTQLFRLLGEDAIMVTEGESEGIKGRVAIVEAIENVGSERANVRKEKVAAYLVLYDKDGEIYPMLRYQRGEETEHWVLDICYDGEKIQRIEIHRPHSGSYAVLD